MFGVFVVLFGVFVVLFGLLPFIFFLIIRRSSPAFSREKKNIAIPFNPYVLVYWKTLRWKICSFSSPIHMDWEGLSLSKQFLDEKLRSSKECPACLPSTSCHTRSQAMARVQTAAVQPRPSMRRAAHIANVPRNLYRPFPDQRSIAAASFLAELPIHLSLTTSTIWGWLTEANTGIWNVPKLRQ